MASLQHILDITRPEWEILVIIGGRGTGKTTNLVDWAAQSLALSYDLSTFVASTHQQIDRFAGLVMRSATSELDMGHNPTKISGPGNARLYFEGPAALYRIPDHSIVLIDDLEMWSTTEVSRLKDAMQRKACKWVLSVADVECPFGEWFRDLYKARSETTVYMEKVR